MSAALDLSELCGNLLLVGFPGKSIDTETRRALMEGRRAGLVFFKRNVESVEAVHALCREIVEITRGAHGPFIAVDQEGGRVMRLPSPAVQLPPMRAFGDLGHGGLALRAGATMGAELFAMGFNVNFAPVLDVDSNPKNPVIGDRAFSREPAKVMELGVAFAEGLEARGVMACGKHFPGHGDTDVDSHLDLPHVRHPRERLDEVELLPFRKAAHTMGSLMSAHVVYDALDPGVPATLSRKILTDLLRKKFAFRGVVFSDDLEMKALADRHAVEESAVQAVRAGCDVLLVCQDQGIADRAHAALVRAATDDEEFRIRCIEAADRSLSARRRFTARPAASTAALARAIDESGAPGVLAEFEGRRSRMPPAP